MVHRLPVCAGLAAAARNAALIPRIHRNIRLFINQSPCFFRIARLAAYLQILVYTYRCANLRQSYPQALSGSSPSDFPRWSPRFLAVDFDVVGDHRALIIADGLDFGDCKTLVVEFGQ